LAWMLLLCWQQRVMVNSIYFVYIFFVGVDLEVL
jgi:hypothetical protein